MSESVLEEMVAVIAAQPHGGQSLLLYALCKTIDMPKGGHMYMLKKLQEMTPHTRQIAYRLMEHMAMGNNTGQQWQDAVARLDQIIKGG